MPPCIFLQAVLDGVYSCSAITVFRKTEVIFLKFQQEQLLFAGISIK